MAADKRCCVPGCGKTRETNILHRFPNPQKECNRFQSWASAVGGNILARDETFVYKYRRICHLHFEERYLTRSKLLSRNAVPTLHLRGLKRSRSPNLSDSQDHNWDHRLSPYLQNPNTKNIVNAEEIKVKLEVVSEPNRGICLSCSEHSKEELDKRNEHFSDLIKEELNHILPCMRSRCYAKILFFLDSMKGNHTDQVDSIDTEIN